MARPALKPGDFGKRSVSFRQKENAFVASVRYRRHDGDTTRILARGPDEDTALRLLEEKASRVRLMDEDRALTLYQAAHETIDHLEVAREKLRPQTATSYRGTLDRHLRDHPCGRLDPRTLTVPRAQELIDTTAEAAPSQGRILRIILRSTYDRLLRVGVIDHSADNIFAHTLPPLEKKANPIIFPFEDIPDLRAGLRSWAAVRTSGPPRPTYLIDLIDILLLTGIRVGEALALRWCDIELPASALREAPCQPQSEEAAALPYPGEQAKAALTVNGTLLQQRFHGRIRQEMPKSDTSWRRIIVSETVMNILISRHRLVAGIFSGGSPWVFPNRDGTSPILIPSMSRSWRQARAHAGYPDLTLHALRRTLATYLDEALAERGGLEVARRVLGHSSAEITERHYRAKTAASVPDVSTIMEQILSTGVQMPAPSAPRSGGALEALLGEEAS